jgi:hypothetical protein
MQTLLLMGLAVTSVGLLGGWILRRHAPRLAHIFHFGASALLRLLGTVALGWIAAGALEHHDALHIGAAFVCSVLALFLALTTVLMLYVAVSGSTRPPSIVRKSR